MTSPAALRHAHTACPAYGLGGEEEGERGAGGVESNVDTVVVEVECKLS